MHCTINVNHPLKFELTNVYLRMELHLNRVDHLTTGATSHNCLKVLPSPPGKKIPQRVAVGDHNGVLTCFHVRKNDLNIDFKTLPGPKIERLELGGAVGSLREKVFVSSNSEVKGYTKKGKQFLVFDTNLSDTIRSMYVWGADLHITGQYIYNMYSNCQDAHFFLSSDKIWDLCGVPGN